MISQNICALPHHREVSDGMGVAYTAGCVFSKLRDLAGGGMSRERVLKVVLVSVGLLFAALVYPLMIFLWQEPALAMMLSLYVTLGIFLLLAARNPSASRNLIAFTAWSSFAHAIVMVAQAFHDTSERGHLLGGSVALVIIGAALIVLVPAKKSSERASVAGA